MDHLQLFENFQDDDETEIVYHGSRHKFNEFMLDMFGEGEGEGEGASGFGHGIYFTDNIYDAQFYAQKLEHMEGKGFVYTVRIPNRKFFYNLDKDFADQSQYAQDCFLNMPKKNKLMLFKDEYEEYIEKTEEEIAAGEYDEETIPEIRATYDEFLDDQLKDMGNMMFERLKEVYYRKEDEQYYASKFMEAIGIKGLVHNGFEDTHYIVFDDDDIQVIDRVRQTKVE